jgi:hypothetical protein
MAATDSGFHPKTVIVKIRPYGAVALQLCCVLPALSLVAFSFITGGCTTAQAPLYGDLRKPAAEYEANLIGEWRDEQYPERFALIFYPDGRATMYVDGKSLKERIASKGFIKYSVDTAKHPMELDLIGVSNAGKETGRMKMIFEYLTQTTMRITLKLTNDRPADFVSGDSTIMKKLQAQYDRKLNETPAQGAHLGVQ